MTDQAMGGPTGSMHHPRSFIAVAAACMWLLNTLIPKQNKAVLYGYPDGEDSISEMTRCISARGDMRTILLVDRLASRNDFASTVVRLKRKSLRGLWHFLTARYVFFTHGLYLSPRPPSTQTCVNVWHGMPFKRIGHMLGRVPPNSSHVIATSKFFRGFVSQSFGKPEGEVLVTGIPRNDVMVRAAARSAEIKRAMGLGGSGELPRLLFWLPTYREAVRGLVRTDGRSHSSIFGMDDMDVEAFEAFLAKNNCICVAKPHPMAAEYGDKIGNGRIRIWRDADIAARGLSLYEIVGAADLLITDASSVYVDYLMLDRPVVIAFPDIDEYSATRGFSFEGAEQYFAGPLVRSFAELCGAIAESLATDSHAARREQVAALFHDVRDDNAAERLINAVLPTQASVTRQPVMQAANGLLLHRS